MGTVAPLEFAYIAAVGYHMLPKRSLTPAKQHQHVQLLRPKSILLGQTKYDDRAYTLRYIIVLTPRVWSFIAVICNSEALLKPGVCAQIVDGGVAYPSA